MTGKRRLRVMYVVAGVVLVLAVAVLAFWAGRQGAIPTRLAAQDWRIRLAAESVILDECAECHEAQDYHGCETCHDDHGAIEFADLPFYSLITLAGDVPEPGFVSVHQILPYQDQPETRVQLSEFLAEQGLSDFESVTLMSNDGGFVTLQRDQLTDRAWLLPYEDGVRFACEDLHVSSWLKGITRLIVVGVETPLIIDGVETSMGRLLLGPTVKHTVEQTEVSLRSEQDGAVRAASVASRLEGVPLAEHLDLDRIRSVQVRTSTGELLNLDRDSLYSAFLTQFRGQTTLVLPGRGRTEWVAGLIALEGVP